MKSKVYAIDMRAGYRENMLEKLERLLEAVGLDRGIKARARAPRTSARSAPV